MRVAEEGQKRGEKQGMSSWVRLKGLESSMKRVVIEGEIINQRSRHDCYEEMNSGWIGAKKVTFSTRPLDVRTVTTRYKNFGKNKRTATFYGYLSIHPSIEYHKLLMESELK